MGFKNFEQEHQPLDQFK